MLLVRTPWASAAACAGLDPDLFHPFRGESTSEAVEVCRGCVVRPQCLDHALATNERQGIWGGLSGRERQEMRRRGQTAADLADQWATVERDELVSTPLLPPQPQPETIVRKGKSVTASGVSKSAGQAAASVSSGTGVDRDRWRKVQVTARPTLPGLRLADPVRLEECPVCGGLYRRLHQHQRGGHHRQDQLLAS